MVISVLEEDNSLFYVGIGKELNEDRVQFGDYCDGQARDNEGQ